jgi:hypothetical protein
MRMTRLTTRNVLLVIGIWEASNLVAMLFRVLFIPIGNRLIFTGDAGIVELWLWQGLPDALVAAIAAIVLVWVIETKRPLGWVSVLAALFLYGGGLNAWKWIRRGWVTSPSAADNVGILAQAIIPVLVCLVVGVGWIRHSAPGGWPTSRAKA